MNILELIIGKTYTLSHKYGQPNQEVKILRRRVQHSDKWGDTTVVDVLYTSNDSTHGMRTTMNTIECERLHEILKPDINNKYSL